MSAGRRPSFAARAAAACALSIVLPSAAAQRGSLVLLDVGVADASPMPDVAAARASLSASGNTPQGWLAGQLEGLGYTLIEGARVDTGLRALGTSRAACAEPACAAQLGAALGAERVAFGKVIKVSSILWVIDATLVDAGRKRILRREQLELNGDVAQLLPRAMLSMARRLAAADLLRGR